MNPSERPRPLLSVRRLRVHLPRRGLFAGGRVARAVEDLHFDLRAGETVAIVGEPGSGKSVLAAALSGAQAATSGSIAVAGVEQVGADARTRATLRLAVRSVPQQPGTLFKGRQRLGALLQAELRALQPKQSDAARAGRLAQVLAAVGLDDAVLNHRGRDLDAVQRARAALALAVLPVPRVLVVDGPDPALPAEQRMALLDAVADLQHREGFALVLTSRSFAEVERIAQRVLVLTIGRTMEQGPMATVLDDPAHPYTRRLLALEQGQTLDERTEEGESLDARPAPSSEQPPMGCVFHTRCGLVERACVQTVPLLKRTRGADHYAACHFAPVPPG